MQRHMVKKARDIVTMERDGWKAEDGELPQMPFEGVLGEFFISAGHTVHVARMEDVKEILIALVDDCLHRVTGVSSS